MIIRYIKEEFQKSTFNKNDFKLKSLKDFKKLSYSFWFNNLTIIKI